LEDIDAENHLVAECFSRSGVRAIATEKWGQGQAQQTAQLLGAAGAPFGHNLGQKQQRPTEVSL
jgi:hypothetical protein